MHKLFERPGQVDFIYTDFKKCTPQHTASKIKFCNTNDNILLTCVL